MIAAKLNVSKIDKSALFKGEKGVYLDLALFDNKNGQDDHGNDGFVVQSLSKERREAGEKGPIIGNWRHVGKAKPATAPKAQDPDSPHPNTDHHKLPF